MGDFELGSVEPGELDRLAATMSWAFGFPAADAKTWLSRNDPANVRVARRDGAVLGGLLQIPMGQWFGGRSISMLGLAGVAVSPEARGSGVALAMVVDALRRARDGGVALSALYPATLRLYRAAGYELAGTYCKWSARLSDLPTGSSSAPLEVLESRHEAGVEELYRAFAARRNGYLDRGPYVWRQVRSGAQEPHRGYVVRTASGIDGYTYLSRRNQPDGVRELVVHDLVTRTPEALQRLLALFADHRSTIRAVSWHGAPDAALMMLLSERVYKIEVDEHWMLRIVDVERALSARGYANVTAELELDVVDETLAENSGRYRVQVADGRAQVVRGGSGRAKLSIQTLAAVYTGFMPASELVRAGRLEADEQSLRTMDLLFSGSVPAMSDFF